MELGHIHSKTLVRFSGQIGNSILFWKSKSQSLYIIGTNNGHLMSIDMNTNDQIQNRQTSQSCIYCLTLDQSHNIWTGGDKELHLYKSSDLQSAILLENLAMWPIKRLSHHEDIIIGISWLGLGLISASEDGKISFWDSKTEKVSIQLSLNSSILCFDISHDGKKIAAGSSDPTLAITDFGSNNNTEQSLDEKIWVMRFLQNGDLITGGHSGVIKVLDIKQLMVKKEIRAHESRVKSIDLSKNCRVIASAGFDQKVLIHDLETQKVICVYQHEDWARCVRIDEDNSKIVSVADDETFASNKFTDFSGGNYFENILGNKEKKPTFVWGSKPESENRTGNYSSFPNLNEKNDDKLKNENNFRSNQGQSYTLKKVIAGISIVIILLLIVKISQ